MFYFFVENIKTVERTELIRYFILHLYIYICTTNHHVPTIGREEGDTTLFKFSSIGSIQSNHLNRILSTRINSIARRMCASEDPLRAQALMSTGALVVAGWSSGAKGATLVCCASAPHYCYTCHVVINIHIYK